MASFDSQTIPEGHFHGGASITEGNIEDAAIGDLRTILNNVVGDLEKLQIPLSEVGALQTFSVSDPGGASNDTDIAIPTGMQIKITGVKTIVKGAGTAGDTVRVKKVVTGPTVTTISEALDISASVANDVVNAAKLEFANYALNGTNGDLLRVSVVDGAGADVPATETLIEFVRTA